MAKPSANFVRIEIRWFWDAPYLERVDRMSMPVAATHAVGNRASLASRSTNLLASMKSIEL